MLYFTEESSVMVRSILAKKVSFLFKIDKSIEIIDIQIVSKISRYNYNYKHSIHRTYTQSKSDVIL